MIALAVDPDTPIQKALEAGRDGAPSPKRASRHNYSDGEQRAWEAGMEERCHEQYQALDE